MRREKIHRLAMIAEEESSSSFLRPRSSRFSLVKGAVKMRSLPSRSMCYLIVMGLLFLNLFLGFFVVSDVCDRGCKITVAFHLIGLARRLEFVASW